MNKVGWEGLLYIGAYGGTATTLLPLRRDARYDCPMDFGETTSAGDGTAIPIMDQRPVKLSPRITFNMILNTADSTHLTLVAAATNTTPTPLAMRHIAHASGLGPDADFYVSMTLGTPYQGETTYDFECVATTDGGRAISLNV